MSKPEGHTTADGATAGVILIVEDEPILRGILDTAVRAAGWQSLCVASAEDALSAIEAGTAIRLVLTDLGLPGMSGLDLARKLRSTYKLPFVVLTAHEEEDKINTAVEEGALSYLVKPVDVTRLLPIMRVALARHDDQSALERALKADRSVAVAVGILMKQHGVGEQRAFAMLRDEARSRRLKLPILAKKIIKDSESPADKA